MKLKMYLLFFLITISVFIYCQKSENANLLINLSRSVALRTPGSAVQYPEPTYALRGMDIKILFNTNIQYISFMTGSTILIGENLPNESSTYGGGCYFGPYLSVGRKWIRPWAYIGLGMFSFHDDIMRLNSTGLIDYYQESNFSSFGTKSALGFSIVFKSLSFNLGYQFFTTASDKTTLLQHGYETGIGIKF